MILRYTFFCQFFMISFRFFRTVPMASMRWVPPQAVRLQTLQIVCATHRLLQSSSHRIFHHLTPYPNNRWNSHTIMWTTHTAILTTTTLQQQPTINSISVRQIVCTIPSPTTQPSPGTLHHLHMMVETRTTAVRTCSWPEDHMIRLTLRCSPCTPGLD